LKVLRSYKGQVDEIATFVNLGHKEYAVRAITPTPPFPAWVTRGYNQLVRSLKLPNSGNARQ
jgi:hypothetical protein